MHKRELIIFTDLDGTLLDSGYSFSKAEKVLELIRNNGIPLIICSSKTRAEIEVYRKKINNDHPFISENGGGIFIPKQDTQFKVKNLKLSVKEEENYYVIKLGADYSDLRNQVNELCSEGFDLRGFGDMSVKEISELTGLSIEEAGLSRMREFDEPFVFKGDEISLQNLMGRITEKGFNFAKSRFCHIMGSSDKGRAVEILKGLYKEEKEDFVTIALGDALNDLEMLQQADHAVIVQKPDGSYETGINIKGLVKADGIGPEGWNKALLELINKFQ